MSRIHYSFSMKKYFIALTVTFTLLFSPSSHAQVDPRLKMMATMAGYGVVGGALLGTATLAFGAGGRSIAKGASLGLYAGLIFGGYILVNYELKKRGYGQEQKGDYYPEGSSPYEEESSFLPAPEEYNLAQYDQKKDQQAGPQFYLNFVNYTF